MIYQLGDLVKVPPRNSHPEEGTRVGIVCAADALVINDQVHVNDIVYKIFFRKEAYIPPTKSIGNGWCEYWDAKYLLPMDETPIIESLEKLAGS